MINNSFSGNSMDGRECLKTIKSDSRLKSIPVIVYSTSENPMDIALCRYLGALDYLIKPNTMEEAVLDLSKYF
jgi:CheY-like chemotaxis protein